MSETPTTDRVREDHERGTTFDVPHFDRWLERVRAEAKAEALDEVADWVRDSGGDLVSRGIEDELMSRAAQYRKGTP